MQSFWWGDEIGVDDTKVLLTGMAIWELVARVVWGGGLQKKKTTGMHH